MIAENVAFGIVAAAIMWVALERTRWGYEIRLIGDNPAVARWLQKNIESLLYVANLGSGSVTTIAGWPGLRGSDNQDVPPFVIAEMSGNHNHSLDRALAVAPDGKSYYITIAHGTPFGSLWKMDASGDSLLMLATYHEHPDAEHHRLEQEVIESAKAANETSSSKEITAPVRTRFTEHLAMPL